MKCLTDKESAITVRAKQGRILGIRCVSQASERRRYGPTDGPTAHLKIQILLRGIWASLVVLDDRVHVTNLLRRSVGPFV